MIVLFDELPSDLWRRLDGVGITHARLFARARAIAALGPGAAFEAIASWPGVERVYPDRPIELANFQAMGNTGVTRIRAGERPLHRAYLGEGTTIAVVDTGIQTTHPDLDDRVVRSLSFAASMVLDPVAPQSGPLVREPVVDPIGVDFLGHGTHVSAIAAGTGEAAKRADMRGVAPGAALVSFLVAGVTDGGFESSALAAYEWILGHRDDPEFPGGIRVINNSWGLFSEVPALRRLIGQAIEAGIVVVFAAGNEGHDGMRWPARYPEVIAVGAVCKDEDDWSHKGPLEWAGGPPVGPAAQICGPDRVTSFSGRGEQIDVVAPGFDVWSAYAPGQTLPGFYPLYSPPVPGSGDAAAEANNRLWYGSGGGTSQAAPHVSGVVALMLEANPCLDHRGVEEILRSTAHDLGPKGFDEASGYGRVDAFRAVARAEREASSCRPRTWRSSWRKGR